MNLQDHVLLFLMLVLQDLTVLLNVLILIVQDIRLLFVERGEVKFLVVNLDKIY